MSKLIRLANKSFTLDTSEIDNARRKTYFRTFPHPTVDLTPTESEILAALGIDEETKLSLRTYLGKFFEELPYCQSDASLILNQRCEIPYYVIWSTQLAAQKTLNDRITENQRITKSISDIHVAMDDFIIGALTPLQPTLNVYDQVFQLVSLRSIAPAAEPLTEYDRVFQLTVDSQN